MVTILQYIHVSNHYVVDLWYNVVGQLYLDKTRKNKLKNKIISTITPKESNQIFD